MIPSGSGLREGRERHGETGRAIRILNAYLIVDHNMPWQLPQFWTTITPSSLFNYPWWKAAHIIPSFIYLLTNILYDHSLHPFYCPYSSSVPPTLVFPFPFALPGSTVSGILITPTTQLVHPVKCCVRWPLPVSGLYCSQANPVSAQLS